jgi:hypothetical protein
MRTAAAPEHDEKDNRPEDRNEERPKTAKAIGEEGKHLLDIAAA